MKKIECFLSDDEQKDVENFIKDMLKHKKIDMEGTGGLEVHVECRGKEGTLFFIHRIVGSVFVPAKARPRKKEEVKTDA